MAAHRLGQIRDRPRPFRAADDPPAQAPSMRGAAPSPRLALRILVVDDDPLMTDLLPRKLLRVIAAPPPLVLTASTPEEGIRLATIERPDVVLSDYNLRSSLTGLDVLDAVRRSHPLAVRVLFSAHTRTEIGPSIDAADIHGFVEKTMRLDEMMGPILDALRSAGIRVERQGPGGP